MHVIAGLQKAHKELLFIRCEISFHLRVAGFAHDETFLFQFCKALVTNFRIQIFGLTDGVTKVSSVDISQCLMDIVETFSKDLAERFACADREVA